ncbi:MAG: HIT domain-containing protein [Actinomycetota bacterium]|nr:HIT domain-containing protein [Actinomycetota bacterium]
MPLERLWAGWRGEYVDSGPGGGEACVFCTILASGEDDSATFVLWRGESTAVVLNAFPYTSGHVLVLPLRHIADLEQLNGPETVELWSTVTAAVVAIKEAYRPGGLNVGSNLGRSAGAGVPGHLHVHCLPRWNGDTNFMTSLAEARVLPEALSTTWRRLRSAWPSPS